MLGSNPDKKPKGATVVLDGEELTLPNRETTPNTILGIAGLDSSTHYLVEIKGRHQESYQGRGDEPLKVKDRDTFISLSTGPTPTS